MGMGTDGAVRFFAVAVGRGSDVDRRLLVSLTVGPRSRVSLVPAHLARSPIQKPDEGEDAHTEEEPDEALTDRPEPAEADAPCVCSGAGWSR